jgi:hypothetical protein
MFWWIEEGKLVKITFRLLPFFVLTVLNVRNVLNYKCFVVTLSEIVLQLRFSVGN